MTIQPVYIQQPKLVESSGICRSLLIPDSYLSHNDAGSAPVLYAFDANGANKGEFPLLTKAVDCEDISSAVVNGVPTIILADVGDNTCVRSSYKIYVVAEIGTPMAVKVVPIEFKYPDGKKRNCESCALLPDGRIILVTKSYPAQSGPTQVFTILSWLCGNKTTTVVAGPELNKNMSIITSMDFHTQLFVLLGNQKAHIFSPLWIKIGEKALPKSFQPEGICWTHDLQGFLMTSEVDKTKGGLTPLWNVPL